jgi:hypothetical protein
VGRLVSLMCHSVLTETLVKGVRHVLTVIRLPSLEYKNATWFLYSSLTVTKLQLTMSRLEEQTFYRSKVFGMNESLRRFDRRGDPRVPNYPSATDVSLTHM